MQAMTPTANEVLVFLTHAEHDRINKVFYMQNYEWTKDGTFVTLSKTNVETILSNMIAEGLLEKHEQFQTILKHMEAKS